MARPERKNVDYFPHYISHGSKMQYLQNKFNNDGYATWYKLMEKLGKADNHYLDLSDDIQLELLADYCLVEIETLVSIIEFLVRAKWLHKKLWEDHKVLFSEEFLSSVGDAYVRRINDCIKSEAIELMYYRNPQEDIVSDDINTQSKEEYIKEKNSKEKNSKSEKPKQVFHADIYKCYEECLKHFPEHLQPNTEKIKNDWLAEIEKLNRIDKIPFEKIVDIVKRTRSDVFWAKNFLSITKLRKTNSDGIKYAVVFNEQIKSNSTNGKRTKEDKYREVFAALTKN